MIKCKRNKVLLAGDPVTLITEFGVIARSLRKTLTRKFDNKFDAETVRKMMDAVYNFREEDETC